MDKWIIQTNCYTDGNPERIISHAISLGHKVKKADYHPLDINQNQEYFSTKVIYQDIVPYGSIEFIKKLQQKGAYIPWCDWNALACHNYLSKLADYSVHHDYGFVPLSELLKPSSTKIFSKYSDEDGRMFIKSDTNSKGYAGKGFAGDVVYEGMMSQFIKEVLHEVDPSCLALVSKPQTILNEWRLVIANGEVLTGSQYREMINGSSSIEIKAGYPDELKSVAKEIAHNIDLGPIWVLDMSYTKDNGYKMIELGSIHCAGLYDCEIEKIVDFIDSLSVDWSPFNSLHV